MQKVEGSSPFIRFSESPAQAGFLLPSADTVCCRFLLLKLAADVNVRVGQMNVVGRGPSTPSQLGSRRTPGSRSLVLGSATAASRDAAGG